MRRPLRWQPVHLSSVGWWQSLGFHEHALHRRGGEAAGRTDKLPSTIVTYMLRRCCNDSLRLVGLGTLQVLHCTLMGSVVLEKSRGALLDATMSFPFCWWFALLSYFLSFCHNLLCFIQVHTWKWKECMYMCMYVRRLIIMSNKSYDLLLYSAVVCSINTPYTDCIQRGSSTAAKTKCTALHCRLTDFAVTAVAAALRAWVGEPAPARAAPPSAWPRRTPSSPVWR